MVFKPFHRMLSLVYEMDLHKEFTKWALAQGVKLNGIAAHSFPGRGVGIIAEKELEVGETILTVPTGALRTVRTVPKSVSKSIGTITVHGILAAELAMDTSKARAQWRAVLPTKESFEESIPLLWDPSLQALLPPASSSLLANQKQKISVDWATVSAAFPKLSYESYLYHWLIVNTRTFYYTSPKIKVKKPLNPDECLALVPIADYFNHAGAGSEVTYSPSGYRICTDQRVEKGEEIYISYGNHSNDFLLAEYGFILDENKWDEISIDDLIIPLFSDKQKQTLKEANFLGKFVLDREMVCYRTQVALRLLCMAPNRWQYLVTNGLQDDDKHQATVNKILIEVLKAHLNHIHEKLKHIEMLDCGLPIQRDTLNKRWKQIHLLINTAISRIQC